MQNPIARRYNVWPNRIMRNCSAECWMQCMWLQILFSRWKETWFSVANLRTCHINMNSFSVKINIVMQKLGIMYLLWWSAKSVKIIANCCFDHIVLPFLFSAKAEREQSLDSQAFQCTYDSPKWRQSEMCRTHRKSISRSSRHPPDKSWIVLTVSVGFKLTCLSPL